MKILLMNQFFWPDSAATSQFLTDLARGLTERGHEVHVICAASDYALADLSQPPACTVHRVKSAPFVRGSVGRVLSYASFFVMATLRALRVPRPDLVITLTTPPLLSLIGAFVQFCRRSKHFIWEMDVYPDVAIDLNYLRRDGIPARVLGKLADLPRRTSDGILALGPCMRDRLLRRGIPADKIHVTENWADGNLIQPAPWANNTSPLTVLYSGNLGLAHDTDTIASAMLQLKRDTGFRFVFAGSGSRREQLISWCEEQGIASAEFRSYSQRANLGESLGSGDIGLVTQQAKCVGSVVPSKAYGLLAAGRPILYIGPKTSTVAALIERHRCGWQIDNGDVAALTALLVLLANNREQVRQAGARARETFVKHYDIHVGVARICTAIGAAALEEHSAPLALSAVDTIGA